MEKIDRIFDAPVEWADRLFEMPANMAASNSRNYERYVTGLHWLEASGFLFVGGLASAAAGVEAGGATAILSIGLAYAGTLKAVLNHDRIKNNRSVS